MGLAACQKTPTVNQEGVVNQAVLTDIAQKKINLSRWGDRGRRFQLLQPGMTKREVVTLLGTPDEFPKDKPDILQFSPDDHFDGGATGPDWALELRFEAGKLKEVRFSKRVYGPPPG